MSEPELQLFVLWEKSRHLETRILEDMARHLEIVYKCEIPIEGRASDFYRRFYGHMPLNGTRKARNCGKGPFLLVIVRDHNPIYRKGLTARQENRTMIELKARYREWTTRGYRIHGTLTAHEFIRDVKLLTGHTAKEWEAGIPSGKVAPDLPPIESLPPLPNFFTRWKLKRARKHECHKKKRTLSKRMRTAWWDLIMTEGLKMGLTDCRIFLENKMVNDVFFEGLFRGRPCVVKCSSRAPDSIRNEYEISQRVYQKSPICAEPLAYYCTPDGKMAFVVMEKLCDLTHPKDPANDILHIAEVLYATGVVHRDISVNNLFLGNDGHLRLIDFQFAINRNNYQESKYMRAHPIYLYMTFGNCEELGVGRWNDLLGFGLINCLQHFNLNVADVQQKLFGMVPKMMFEVSVPLRIRVMLHLTLMKLRFQVMFNHKKAFRWRVMKLSRLLRTCN